MNNVNLNHKPRSKRVAKHQVKMQERSRY